MIFLIILITYDSLPPLPDLSQVSFPEPPLWVYIPDDFLDVSGGAGEFTFASGHLLFKGFQAFGYYSDRFNWCTARNGELTCSYAHGFSHLWVQPVFSGLSLKRDTEKYLGVKPGLNFMITNPLSIFRGSFGYTIWDLNTMRTTEVTSRLDIFFDQIQNKPQIVLESIYENDHYTQLAGVGIHIQSFHIHALSPVTEYFPSPRISIDYRHASYKIFSEIQSGVDLKTLSDRFDPSLPLRYSIAVPDESLRVAVHFGVAFDFYSHTFEIRGDYCNWYNRLTPARNFILSETYDIQELHIGWILRNAIEYTGLHVANVFCGNHAWCDTTLPFQPDYSIMDTLSVEYALAFAQAALEYRSAHQGIAVELPASVFLNTRAGIQYHGVSFFIAIMNTTGIQSQYYDGFWAPARAFAGGIRIKTTL